MITKEEEYQAFKKWHISTVNENGERMFLMDMMGCWMDEEYLRMRFEEEYSNRWQVNEEI